MQSKRVRYEINCKFVRDQQFFYLKSIVLGNENTSLEGIQELIRNDNINTGEESNGYLICMGFRSRVDCFSSIEIPFRFDFFSVTLHYIGQQSKEISK